MLAMFVGGASTDTNMCVILVFRHAHKPSITFMHNWVHVNDLQALGGSVDSNPCHACSMMGPFTCNTNQACET